MVKYWIKMVTGAVVFAAVLALLMAGCANTRHIEIKRISSNTFAVTDWHSGFNAGGDYKPPYSALEETCPSIGKNIGKISESHGGTVVVTCAIPTRPFNPNGAQ